MRRAVQRLGPAPASRDFFQAITAATAAQAAAEAALFRDRFPELAAGGRTTSGALVRRLNGMFLEHVRTSWAPATLRRLAAALDETQAADAALGLPAVSGADPAAACAMAAAEAQRMLAERLPPLVHRCCREVLEPLRRRLAALPPPGPPGGTGPAAQWEAECGDAARACEEGAAEWAAFWRRALREALDDGPAGSPPGAGGASRKRGRVSGEAGRREAFRLSRFPAFVQAAAARGDAVVTELAAAALKDAAATAEAFFSAAARTRAPARGALVVDAAAWPGVAAGGGVPAWVRARANLGGAAASVAVDFDREGLQARRLRAC